MSITPNALIPRTPRQEIIVARVVGVFAGWVVVAIRPGLHVRVKGEAYQVGQRVVMGLPGGDVGSAQIIGVSSGKESETYSIVL